jgi:hypothetical protein
MVPWWTSSFYILQIDFEGWVGKFKVYNGTIRSSSVIGTLKSCTSRYSILNVNKC